MGEENGVSEPTEQEKKIIKQIEVIRNKTWNVNKRKKKWHLGLLNSFFLVCHMSIFVGVPVLNYKLLTIIPARALNFMKKGHDYMHYSKLYRVVKFLFSLKEHLFSRLNSLLILL